MQAFGASGDWRREGCRSKRLICGTPPGTEAIHKIYAESNSRDEHLASIEAEAQAIANQAFAVGVPAPTGNQLEETK